MLPISHVPARALTAEQAAQALHPKHPNRPMPATTTAYYGAPLGGIRARRVWGFRSGPAGCLMEFPPSPPPECFDWSLVNAFTGRLVQFVQQPVPSGR